ncbi:MAG: AbrB family transcriptional regulator [Micromonosporaceae bacterium]
MRRWWNWWRPEPGRARSWWPEGSLSRSALLLSGAAAGAAVFLALRVPAGGIFGAVLGSMAVNMARPGRSLAPPLRLCGLLLLGFLAGLALNAGTFHVLRGLAALLAASVAGLLAIGTLCAAWLVKSFGLDWRTAILACAPGGIGELAILAEEVGARVTVVVAMHLVRVVVVVLVALPWLLWYLRVGS